MAKRKKKKQGGSKIGKIIAALVAILILASAVIGYDYYKRIWAPNVIVSNDSDYFYIPTGSTFTDVVAGLKINGILQDIPSFEWLSTEKKYQQNVKPGRYKVKDGMSNNDLINLLRSGEQEPIKVSYNYIILPEHLAGKITRNLEADSAEFYSKLTSSEVAGRFGFNQLTFMTMFIPNTYEMWWNTSEDELFARAAKEYKQFWNGDRIAKARKLGLSQSEVSILASIVQRETTKNDEKPRVAGVYYNRLKKGMLLQADPTLVYAVGDFTIRRVLNKHKKVDSPYNTYIHKGLPPGPICLPSIASIDAVLNVEDHQYIFFCARPDGSGYHDFAVTYRQHLNNARAFQRELNRRKVYK
jgi:UPF0755 protein